MKKPSSKPAPYTHVYYRKRWNIILYAFYMYICVVCLGYFPWASSLRSTGQDELPEAEVPASQRPQPVVAASAELGVTMRNSAVACLWNSWDIRL